MNEKEQNYYELDINAIEETIQNPISGPPSIGIFYGLFGKEYLYHERTLFYMLQDSSAQKKIIRNLFRDENLGDFEMESIKMEKKINDSGRIDLFFNVHFKDGRQSLPVIIELKTNTENHDCQLTRYYESVKAEYGVNPECFYITTDGHSPVSDEDKKIISKYKCLSYLDITKDISSQDSLIQDYLNTVRDNSPKKTYSISDHIQIYNVLFKKLQEKLSTIPGVSPEIECTDSEEHYVECTKEAYDNVKESLHLKLKVTKNNSTLAIERRWKKQGELCRNSLYYGIWKGDNFNKRKYTALINHWDECGRELNYDFNRDEIIKNARQDKSINVNCWYVVQYLTSWPMPLWDSLTIRKGQSDIDSWAQWISVDLDLITDEKEESM